MEELENAVRKGVELGLAEFNKLKENENLDKAYMIAQTKAFRKFLDIYLNRNYK